MSFHEPLFDEFGIFVHGHPSASLLELDHEDLLARFRSEGVLLFRGFPTSERIFREFTEAYGSNFVDHHNLAQRDYIDDDRSFATVNRGQHAIDFHIEMAANPASPDVFWMYCIRPAESRGPTGLVDGVQVLKSLTPQARDIFEEFGHRYVLKDIPRQAWASILPWIGGRADAERWLRSTGQSAGVTHYHFDDHRLTVELYRCPIRQGKFCQQPVFVSGMLDDPSTPLGIKQMPFHLRSEVCQAVYQHAIWLDWQPGDIALIDNTRVMHAREAFEDYTAPHSRPILDTASVKDRTQSEMQAKLINHRSLRPVSAIALTVRRFFRILIGRLRDLPKLARVGQVNAVEPSCRLTCTSKVLTGTLDHASKEDRSSVRYLRCLLEGHARMNHLARNLRSIASESLCVSIRDGVRLHAASRGGHGGPTCVLIHGLGDGAYVWDHAVSHLRSFCNTLCIDLRGHGDSDRSPSGRYDLETHVQDVLDVLEKLRVENPIVCGHSLGGKIAMRLAAREMRNSLRGVALVDISPTPDPECTKQIAEMLKDGLRTYASIDQYRQWLFETRPLISDAMALQIAKAALRTTEQGFVCKFDPAVIDEHRSDSVASENRLLLSSITRPTLIIRGDLSAMMSMRCALAMAQTIPSATLITIPKAGHAVMSDNPTEFAASLDSFVRRLCDYPLPTG